MRFLLDTDTASYAIRGAFPTLDARLASAAPQEMAISVITRAELLFGLEKRGNPRGLSRVVHSFLDRMTNLPWDNAAADTFAKILVQLEKRGTPPTSHTHQHRKIIIQDYNPHSDRSQPTWLNEIYLSLCATAVEFALVARQVNAFRWE